MLNKLNLGILIDFILGLWCQTLSNNKGDNKLVYRCAGNIMSFPLSINNFMELLILMFKCLLSIILLELTSVFNHYSWSICSASLETLSKMSWTAYTFSNTIGDHVYSPQVVWLLHDSVHNDTNGALINYNYSRSRYATITFTWIYYISQMTLRPSVVHFCRYGKWTVISKSIGASCFQNLWGSSVL